MKKIFLVSSVFILSMILFGCSTTSEDEGTANEGASKTEESQTNNQEVNKEQDNSQGWEFVGTEGYRMLATINDVEVNSENFINSLMIEGIEKIPYNYHTDWQAKGTKQQIVFGEELTEFAKKHLVKGQKIVITYGQWAIPPKGKVVMGSQLNSIVFVIDGELYNYKGEEYKQEDKETIEEILDNSISEQKNNSSCETAPQSLSWNGKKYSLKTENTKSLEPATKLGYVECSNEKFIV